MEKGEANDCDVVKEIPLYLCKELQDKLYLFQYPNMTPNDYASLKNVVTSRAKPQYGIIELDCTLNVENEYYDSYVGEELARNTACTRNIIKSEEMEYLGSISFRSQRSVLKNNISSYSVLNVSDGKLCLSPLHESVSFAPTFEYTQKSKKKDKGKEEDVEEDETSTQGAVQVNVKFSHKSSDQMKHSDEMTFNQHEQKVDDEHWCLTIYHECSTPASQEMRKNFARTCNMMNQIGNVNFTNDDYLNVLVPGANVKL